jgi:predicted O-linked N-acetylglucosamine transferase (SPINDLY family)
MDEYLSRFSQMDLYLDTFPYTSGTVASDALFAGCPLLTLSGKTMVSRMSASIVTYAGLPELVALNTNDYINKAISIANSPAERQRLSSTLKQQKNNKNLFNTKNYVYHLENVIKKIVN